MLGDNFLKGINQLGLDLSQEQLNLFSNYLDLLLKWNKSFNLTAVRNRADMEVLHLLDSLSIVPFIKQDRYIDVGTGGGLPGVVLAIVFPKKHFTLLDSNSKKTRFLNQVKRALQLDNIEVVHSRAENFQPNEKFDGVISRAFADFKKMQKLCQHLCKENGKLLAMQGKVPEQLDGVEIHRLLVPYLDADRCLVMGFGKAVLSSLFVGEVRQSQDGE